MFSLHQERYLILQGVVNGGLSKENKSAQEKQRICAGATIVPLLSGSINWIKGQIEKIMTKKEFLEIESSLAKYAVDKIEKKDSLDAFCVRYLIQLYTGEPSPSMDVNEPDIWLDLDQNSHLEVITQLKDKEIKSLGIVSFKNWNQVKDLAKVLNFWKAVICPYAKLSLSGSGSFLSKHTRKKLFKKTKAVKRLEFTGLTFSSKDLAKIIGYRKRCKRILLFSCFLDGDLDEVTERIEKEGRALTLTIKGLKGLNNELKEATNIGTKEVKGWSKVVKKKFQNIKVKALKS